MNSPDRRVVVRYSLMQIPGILLAVVGTWLLNRWFGLPLWAAAGIVLLWIAKDVAMFFVTWKSYAGGGGDVSGAMIGLQGETIESLDPEGRVSVRGENWQARLMGDRDMIPHGEPVVVVGMEGLTLLVSPPPGSGEQGSEES